MATKKASRKAAVPAEAKVAVGTTNLKLDMPIDAKKAEAIRRCVAKGTLSITLNKINLASGRLGDGWLYD